MSFTYDTYVGPYARCAVARAPITKLRIACLNETCKNHERDMRVKFCELCGSQTGTVSHAEMRDAVDQWEVQEEIDEALCSPGGDGYMNWTRANGAHLWKPNQHMPGRDPHLESREDFALFEITSQQIDAERIQ